MSAVGLGEETIARENRIIIQQCLKLNGFEIKKKYLRIGCV